MIINRRTEFYDTSEVPQFLKEWEKYLIDINAERLDSLLKELEELMETTDKPKLVVIDSLSFNGKSK